MDGSKSPCAVAEVIENYRLLKDKLDYEVKDQKSGTMSSLDGLVMEEFDKILDLAPANSAEAVKLVEFLLAALDDLTIGSPLPDQINEKILQIVATDFSA